MGSAIRALSARWAASEISIPGPDLEPMPAQWRQSPGPLCLVFLHGVGGHHQSREAASLAGFWQRSGLGSVLLFSLPGAFSAPLQPRLYHAGCSGELECAVSWVLPQLPRNSRILVVGYSLGANILVKWLGERGDAPGWLAGAISVSNPWNLKDCCEHLESSPMRRLYRAGMVYTLRQRALRFAQRFPGLLNRREILNCVTFRDYDNRITAPLHGFQDADDYYRQCSSKEYLSAVRGRLLCIDAQDDPFIPPETRPPDAPPSVSWLRPGSGGHLGFVGKGATLWLERYLCQVARDWAGISDKWVGTSDELGVVGPEW